MSDFDKEAEREKLREKYDDTDDREATEKMSELLLQGATMTNAHCSQCNDPIFRYDGQEFCATCERPVNRETGGEEAGETDETNEERELDGDSQEHIQVTSPDEDARVAFGGDSAESEAGDGTEAQRTDTQQQTDSQADTDARRPSNTHQQSGTQPVANTHQPTDAQEEGGTQERREARRTAQGPKSTPQRTGSDNVATAGGTDTTAAHESLVRTLTRFSRLAEETDDPQRAREYLVTAREAAEALAALRQ